MSADSPSPELRRVVAKKVDEDLELAIGQPMMRGVNIPHAVLAVAITLASPVFLIAAPLLYAYMASSKERRKRAVAAILPSTMAAMDLTLVDVKRELFRETVRDKRVLDVGCGPGQYLKYLVEGGATHICELEPNKHLQDSLQSAVQDVRNSSPHVHVDVRVGEFVDELPADEMFDVALLGNVCCEMADILETLKQVDAHLVSGGRVIFIEHVRHDDGTFAAALQDAFNPFWRVVADGCNCNRRTLDVVRAVPGWHVVAWELRKPGELLMFNRLVVGVAVKRAM